MAQQISVRIDSELCTATDGQTIFQVAAASGRTIPSLCYLEGLSAPGACRLCLVEVEGVGRLLPAFATTTLALLGFLGVTGRPRVFRPFAAWCRLAFLRVFLAHASTTSPLDL